VREGAGTSEERSSVRGGVGRRKGWGGEINEGRGNGKVKEIT